MIGKENVMRFPNRTSGAYVFCDAMSRPTVLAYHKLCPSYLVLTYCDKIARVHLTSFDVLLHMIPVDSIFLEMSLPLDDDIECTLNLWRRCLKESLIHSS